MIDVLAIKHGACHHCPQPTWHNGAPCPTPSREVGARAASSAPSRAATDEPKDAA